MSTAAAFPCLTRDNARQPGCQGSRLTHAGSGDLHQAPGRLCGLRLMEMEACMAVTAVRLTRSRNAAGDLVVRLGVGLLDEYLEFLAGRCRPNTVLAVAYDLKVFFTVVAKPPRRVRAVDVLAFMTAQRSGGEGRLQVAEAGAGGVSARTLRRRLSSVSGLYGFLLARGDVTANP